MCGQNEGGAGRGREGLCFPTSRQRTKGGNLRFGGGGANLAAPPGGRSAGGVGSGLEEEAAPILLEQPR